MIKHLLFATVIIVLVSLVGFILVLSSLDLPVAPENTTKPNAVLDPLVDAVQVGSASISNPGELAGTLISGQPTAVLISLPTISPIQTTSSTDLTGPKCGLALPGKPLDVSIPDGTILRPGERFVKTWRLVNAGACPWTGDFSIVWFSGELLGAVPEQTLTSLTGAGGAVDISLDLIAPQTAGTYQSNWKLSRPDGRMFGLGPNGDSPFWVRIQVAGKPQAGITPQFRVIETPQVYSSGLLELSISSSVDLDSGKANQAEKDDVMLVAYEGNPDQMALQAENGARLMSAGVLMPTMADCQTIPANSETVVMDENSQGLFLCLRTGQGLPGYLRVINVQSEPKTVTLEYLTWLVP